MADIGGLGLVEGMANKISDFNYTRFFVYFANHMASKITGLYYYIIETSDVHPFGKFKTNTLLSNDALFNSTFAIKEGDGMYVPESERVVLW